MQMLGKMKLIFYVFWLYLLPCPKNVSVPQRGLIFIDATNKLSI